MGNESFRAYDIKTLLRGKILSIRNVAIKNQTVSLAEYFNMLSEYAEIIPDIENALDKFIMYESEQEDFKVLANLTILLKNLGADDIDIESILDAQENGLYKSASSFAKKALEGINELRAQILSADMTGKAKAPQGELSLLETVRGLDYDENTRKLVILAIDDAPVILKSISSTLGNEYTVYTLADPMMLEQILRQITPELFLLDYQMPGRNGFELIPVIRSYPEHKETPIIFLTSEGTMDNLSAAIMLGARDFVVKPVKSSILREKICKHIARKRLF